MPKSMGGCHYQNLMAVRSMIFDFSCLSRFFASTCPLGLPIFYEPPFVINKNRWLNGIHVCFGRNLPYPSGHNLIIADHVSLGGGAPTPPRLLHLRICLATYFSRPSSRYRNFTSTGSPVFPSFRTTSVFRDSQPVATPVALAGRY